MTTFQQDALLWTTADRRERLQELKDELAAHESNMALLYARSAGKLSLTGKGYTKAAENYQATPCDKKRLASTLANLQQQCSVLRQEIALLKNGGSE
jgi:outer membrane protein assembly factor BamD (BamD/ComL family)